MTRFEIGTRVYDRWWPWRVGRVAWVGKTRLRVQFSDDLVTYDRAHCQFLEPAVR